LNYVFENMSFFDTPGDIDPSLFAASLITLPSGKLDLAFGGWYEGSVSLAWDLRTGQLVGIHSYNMIPMTEKDLLLDDQLTWVHERHRGRGIASALWDITLSTETPNQVQASTVSAEGRRLASRLVASYPEIEWSVFYAK
jgi:hypothetical protein